MAFVRAIARAYQHRGLNPDKALHLAQIDPFTIEQDTVGITALQFETLSDAAMQRISAQVNPKIVLSVLAAKFRSF